MRHGAGSGVAVSVRCLCARCAYERSCDPARQEGYGRACWVAQGRGLSIPECDHFVERNWVTAAEWRRARKRLKGLRAV